MIKHKNQRIGVFVDVQNLYYSAKNLYKAKVNFGEILKAGVAGRQLIRALAYVVKAQNLDEQRFFEALDKQGFEVKMKDLQVFYGGHKKGDWDVGIVIDIIRLSNKVDVVVLVTGDGDFIPLVEYLKNHGQYVELIAFSESASSQLIQQADEFLDLSKNKRKYLLAGQFRSVPRKRTSR